MPATQPIRSLDEVAQLGTDLIERCVTSLLRPEDVGKFVAVDVNSGEYEVDDDDYAAITRLHARVPGADVWLGRVGEPAAYRMGLR